VASSEDSASDNETSKKKNQTENPEEEVDEPEQIKSPRKGNSFKYSSNEDDYDDLKEAS